MHRLRPQPGSARPPDPRRARQAAPELGPGRPSAPLRAARARRGAHLAVCARRRGPRGLRRAGSPTARTPEYNGVFSPDGARVLFVAITLSGTQGNLDIAAINADGAGLKTVVGDEGKLSHQDWPVVVARRPPVRVQLDPRGQPGDLHGGGRRHRPRPPDPEPRPRRPPVLVARRQVDRLRHRPLGRPGARRRQARRHRPGPPDPQPRARRLSRLLPRRHPARLRLQPRRPVRGLRRRGRRLRPDQPLAPPAPRHASRPGRPTAAASPSSRTATAGSTSTLSPFLSKATRTDRPAGIIGPGSVTVSLGPRSSPRGSGWGPSGPGSSKRPTSLPSRLTTERTYPRSRPPSSRSTIASLQVWPWSPLSRERMPYGRARRP